MDFDFIRTTFKDKKVLRENSRRRSNWNLLCLCLPYVFDLPINYSKLLLLLLISPKPSQQQQRKIKHVKNVVQTFQWCDAVPPLWSSETQQIVEFARSIDAVADSVAVSFPRNFVGHPPAFVLRKRTSIWSMPLNHHAVYR